MNSKFPLMRLHSNNWLRFKFKETHQTKKPMLKKKQTYRQCERIYGFGYTKSKQNKLVLTMKKIAAVYNSMSKVPVGNRGRNNSQDRCRSWSQWSKSQPNLHKLIKKNC